MEERRTYRGAKDALRKASSRYQAETTEETEDHQKRLHVRNDAATRQAQHGLHQALVDYANAFEDVARIALTLEDVTVRRSDAAEALQVLAQVLSVHQTLKHDGSLLRIDWETAYAPTARSYSLTQTLCATYHPAEASALRQRYEQVGLPVDGFPAASKSALKEGAAGSLAAAARSATAPDVESVGAAATAPQSPTPGDAGDEAPASTVIPPATAAPAASKPVDAGSTAAAGPASAGDEMTSPPSGPTSAAGGGTSGPTGTTSTVGTGTKTDGVSSTQRGFAITTSVLGVLAIAIGLGVGLVACVTDGEAKTADFLVSFGVMAFFVGMVCALFKLDSLMAQGLAVASVGTAVAITYAWVDAHPFFHASQEPDCAPQRPVPDESDAGASYTEPSDVSGVEAVLPHPAVGVRACLVASVEPYDASSAPRTDEHRDACRRSVRDDGHRIDNLGNIVVAHYPDANATMIYWRLDRVGQSGAHQAFTECRCRPATSTRRDCPDSSSRVRAGAFTYVLRHETDTYRHEQSHEVAEFCLDTHEVTNDLFRRVCGDRACRLDPRPPPPTDAYVPRFCTDLNATDDAVAQSPVNCVDADIATEYCRRIGGRLPRDDEWAWAAAGEENRRYPWGSEPPDGRRLNHCDAFCRDAHREAHLSDPLFSAGRLARDGAGTLARVGAYDRYGRGWAGQGDLAGNVAEWTQLGEEFAIRNGGWLDPRRGNPVGARANPAMDWQDFRTDWGRPMSAGFVGVALGFRCAYDVRATDRGG